MSAGARIAAWAAALGLIAALGGCATVVEPEGPRLAGRLSVRVEAVEGRPAQGLAAGFELRGDGQRGELRLFSPLGTALARAAWAPGMARLEANGGVTRFDSLDELALGALGERLPLAALPDWIGGRPWPGAAHTVADRGFEQLGWRVDLSQHAQGRIEARRTAPPPVAVVRVILDEDQP